MKELYLESDLLQCLLLLTSFRSHLASSINHGLANLRQLPRNRQFAEIAGEEIQEAFGLRILHQGEGGSLRHRCSEARTDEKCLTAGSWPCVLAEP